MVNKTIVLKVFLPIFILCSALLLAIFYTINQKTPTSTPQKASAGYTRTYELLAANSTPTPTATPTPTPTATPKPTATPTPTPAPTATPNDNATPTTTEQPPPEQTVQPTDEPTPSATEPEPTVPSLALTTPTPLSIGLSVPTSPDSYPIWAIVAAAIIVFTISAAVLMKRKQTVEPPDFDDE